LWTVRDIRELYVRHGFVVFQRCRELLRDEAEADDVLQEVFVKVLEAPDRFQARSGPVTYLFAVATHLCLTRLRARGMRGDAWQAAVARSLEDDAPPAGDGAAARQLLDRILAEADEDTRALAVYHFVDGLSQGDIARLVGCSRVTVNQRLQRFREAARARSEAP
jgi:RNA polymerase sigma-70 factor (ECF subfamily)